MLCVTVRLGESVYVDGPAKIQLAATINGKARLAFDAPESTTVLREKLVPEEVRTAWGQMPLGLGDSHEQPTR